MCHIRRKFDESAQNDLARSKIAVDYIAAIYTVEKLIREAQRAMKEDEIVFLRYEKVKPILDEMKKWMQQKYTKVLPRSPIGKAIAYALKL